MDFTAPTSQLVFQPSSLGPQCVSVPLTNDSVLEITEETFTLTLNTMERGILLSPSTASVTVVDDGACRSKCMCMHLQE